MNETGEATHYQVELTSRQVLAALVVLLVCLFAAFFAGVWIGRNAEADSAAHEMASVDPVARAGERFDFFSRTTAPPGGGGDAAAGAAADDASAAESDDSETDGALDDNAFGPDPDDAELDTAGAEPADPEDLFEDDPTALDEASGLEPPEQMGRGGRRRRAKARAEDATAATVEDEDEPVETTAAVSAAAPTRAAAPAATPAPATAPAEPGFHIQVLATSDRAKADALVSRLVDADFKAFIVPSNEGGRAVYRVRVGPFSDRALATRQAAELESRWGLESWISPGAP